MLWFTARGQENLVPNGNFEQADASGKWLEGVSRSGAVELAGGAGGRHVRLLQEKEGEWTMLHLRVKIPEGCKALKFTCRLRLQDVQPGEKPWFDAQVIFNFLSAQYGGKQVEPSPGPSHFSGSRDWEKHSRILIVPEGAAALEVMAGLFKTKAGSMEIDDLELVPATEEELGRYFAELKKSEPLPVPPLEKEDRKMWPEELTVSGNRVLSKSGKEVRLRGVVIPSLEWSVQGENLLASVLVAIEQWKSNIIRLEVRDDFWNGESPHQNDGGESYRALVDAVINLAANRGCYVMLDLHRYHAVKPEHLLFWKDAAARYKNHPAVIFDLFNEPHGISWEVWKKGGEVREEGGGPPGATGEADSGKTFQSPGMQALADTVRATGARNVLVVAGIGWSFNLAGIAEGEALEDREGNGIIYSWHVYNWHREWEKALGRTLEKYPVLVGECGADRKKMSFVPTSEQEEPETWAPKFLEFARKKGLHWTAFSFHPGATPVLIQDWSFEPTVWGRAVKEELQK